MCSIRRCCGRAASIVKWSSIGRICAAAPKFSRCIRKRCLLRPIVEFEKIARGTPGFSGADLENLVNEAALWAARQNKKEVEVIDFEMAKDKVLMGAERKSMILSDEEKRTTAYHEAGHALMAKLLPGTDPVHKVTIIPRGRALGVTMQLPTDDRHNYSKEFLYNNLAILMGGRVAEELVFNNVTTGAGNDHRARDRSCAKDGL